MSDGCVCDARQCMNDNRRRLLDVYACVCVRKITPILHFISPLNESSKFDLQLRFIFVEKFNFRFIRLIMCRLHLLFYTSHVSDFANRMDGLNLIELRLILNDVREFFVRFFRNALNPENECYECE